MQDIDSKNSSFWSELCGTGLAKSLGINDFSDTSLNTFDSWYFNYYPYLRKYIPFQDIKNLKVLEIGLGFGTVSRKLMSGDSNYTGLDISKGPVDLLNLVIERNSSQSTTQAVLGSALKMSFQNETFDVVVAIGSLHHTGNLEKAIEECRRVLKPNGKLIFMVYYAYSYRRWAQNFATTLNYFFKELFGYRGVVPSASDSRSRAAYDYNSKGEEAPHTDWISKKSLKTLCSDFKDFYVKLENADDGGVPLKRKTSRKDLLDTSYTAYLGLDAYCVATK